MKAAILVAQKKPLVLADIELPAKLEYGQVLVKVLYSGICGAQLNEIEGTKGPDKFLPHLLGHEGGAEVVDTGPGVTVVKKGDRVVMHWRKGAGIQAAPAKYLWKNKTVNAGWVTTFNEMAVVSENRVTPIPKGYDPAKAALFGCAVTTAFGVIHNNAQALSGESIVIFGAGGVGSAIIQAAYAAGLNPIVAVDVLPFKLKMAKEFGATHVVNGKTADTRNFVQKLFPSGADIVVDTTGINAIRELSYELTAPAGRTILVGVPKKGDRMAIDSFPLHFAKRITGSEGGSCNPTYDIPRLVALEKAGRFSLDKMITKTYSLGQINQAIKAVKEGKVIRVGIKMA
jgi:Zn-dependent alcohol dehydrogenase